MKRKRLLTLFGIASVIVLALRYFPMLETQRSVMKNSEQFTLYSLHPSILAASAKSTNKAFHDFLIIGQTEITNAKVKIQLVDALYRAIDEDVDTAACHNARHGVRAVKGGRVIEATICFECHNIAIYENGKRDFQTMSSSPEKLFNQALVDAGIPLSTE